MKRLIKNASFEMLFSNKSTEATDDLIREIIKLGNSEEILVSLFRTLNFTRFHLRGMVEKIGITTEMGKNVSELLFVIDTDKNADARSVAHVTKKTCQEAPLDR